MSFQEQNKCISNDILGLTTKTVKFCDQMKSARPKIFQSAICFPSKVANKLSYEEN